MKIDLYLTPTPFTRGSIEGKTVVVIDVLRSSTSICQALSSGAKAVIPMSGRSEAVEMWTKIGSDIAVLAGEQFGIKIENFQFGNSPFEFTKENIGDKFVVMVTSNGTPIFGHSKKAALVISCGLVNISRVAQKILAAGNDVVIACAGKDGQFSLEDTLCGGFLIDKIIKAKPDVVLNDAGKMAHLFLDTRKENLAYSISQGEHGRFLEDIGFGKDVEFSSNTDTIPVLPVLIDGKLIIEQ